MSKERARQKKKKFHTATKNECPYGPLCLEIPIAGVESLPKITIDVIGRQQESGKGKRRTKENPRESSAVRETFVREV